jgi:hypothetical protein
MWLFVVVMVMVCDDELMRVVPSTLTTCTVMAAKNSQTSALSSIRIVSLRGG